MIRYVFITFLFLPAHGFGQAYAESRRVSLTIDDVPNTRTYDEKSGGSELLNKLDSLQIPTAIFINEGLVFRGDTTVHIALLRSWIEKSFITPGNHTYAHSRYSQVGYTDFVNDIERGVQLSGAISKENNKSVSYFRFPYNDLGKDSLEHVEIEEYLTKNDYRLTPFTIESSDWMFNALYEHYLKKNDSIRAIEIGEMYVNETLNLFDFFDSLSIAQYDRYVDQIYLCHDNSLNTDYLPRLLAQLKLRGYSFISLDEAMKDPIYMQEDVYSKKWGVSWFYRWMKDVNLRKKTMRLEPDLNGVYKLYESLKKSEGY